MRPFSIFLKWVSALSLDIVLGSVILLHFISRQFAFDPGVNTYFALGVTVWLIYTLDHLSDARKEGLMIKFSHQIHRKYRKEFVLLVFLQILVSIVNLFWLPRKVLFWGFALGFISLAYLKISSILGNKGIKELTISIVYGIGIFLYPLSMGYVTGEMIWFLVAISLLAFVNLCVISLFESDFDRKDGFSSIVSVIGKDKTSRIIWTCLLSLLISLITATYIWGFQVISIFVGAGIGLFSMMMLKPTIFERDLRYKHLSDAIFLLPIFL